MALKAGKGPKKGKIILFAESGSVTAQVMRDHKAKGQFTTGVILEWPLY